jgi:hypothetical protein
MPKNFPDAWKAAVTKRLVTLDTAKWLDGITEIDGDVTETGTGGPSEKNTIHIPTTDFEVDVLINSNTYPVPVQEYTDDEITINLDKYQTKVVPVADDQVIGASYDKIATVTGIMTTNIVEKKYAKAIHSLAPAGNTANLPVLKTTGTADVNGRQRLTYEDLVAFKAAIDAAPFKSPKVGRRLVLCTDHWNDLLLDRKNFGDKLINYNEGDVALKILGFEIYQHLEMPIYNGTTKNAYDSVPGANQYEASVYFHTANVGKKTGLTKQYYKDSASDPDTQTNKIAYRHYFIVVPKQARYGGAIVSAYSLA